MASLRKDPLVIDLDDAGLISQLTEVAKFIDGIASELLRFKQFADALAKVSDSLRV